MSLQGCCRIGHNALFMNASSQYYHKVLQCFVELKAIQFNFALSQLLGLEFGTIYLII